MSMESHGDDDDDDDDVARWGKLQTCPTSRDIWERVRGMDGVTILHINI